MSRDETATGAVMWEEAEAADASLLSMLEARSVAVVGASAREGSFGLHMVTELSRSAAPIELHLVNPRYDEVLGHECLVSLDEVPGAVDLVLLGVRDSVLEDELQRAASRGDRSALIFGSAHDAGYPAGSPLRDRLAVREGPPLQEGLATREGPALQEGLAACDRPPLRERLTAIARGAGMALCGGGCMGFVNLVYGLRAIGYLEPDPLPRGPVAFVSHSGSAFSALLRSHRGLGFTLAVSAGQELVTSAAAYLDYALDLPETGIVALLLETLREPEKFRAALARAAEREIPVVALTVGGSPTGRAMVAAHSGALAGDDGAWEALFDAYGVLRVRDLDEMSDTLELFAAGRRAPQPLDPAGSRQCTIREPNEP